MKSIIIFTLLMMPLIGFSQKIHKETNSNIKKVSTTTKRNVLQRNSTNNTKKDTVTNNAITKDSAVKGPGTKSIGIKAPEHKCYSYIKTVDFIKSNIKIININNEDDISEYAMLKNIDRDILEQSIADEEDAIISFFDDNDNKLFIQFSKIKNLSDINPNEKKIKFIVKKTIYEINLYNETKEKLMVREDAVKPLLNAFKHLFALISNTKDTDDEMFK